jgi:hypothetical protein
MGYDMQLLNLVPARGESEQGHRAAADGLREAVPDACDASVEDIHAKPLITAARDANLAPQDPTYFRANIHTMGILRRIMLDHGMLITSGSHPAFAAYDSAWLKDSPAYEAWRRAEDHVTAFHPEGEVGVPWWKLSSNDNWHVTAEECEQALEAWHRSADDLEPLKPSHDSIWRAWLSFLRRGVVAEGFRVS